MKKSALVLFVAIGLFAGNISHADDSCAQQLAAKDQQIQSLLNIIASNNRSSGEQGTVVVEKPFTCQAICIENMIGTGFRHPGQEYRYHAITSAPTEKEAWDKVVTACNTETQKSFQENRDKFASANVSGYVTVADMNSDDWEQKMVQSFNQDADLNRFCSDK